MKKSRLYLTSLCAVIALGSLLCALYSSYRGVPRKDIADATVPLWLRTVPVQQRNPLTTRDDMKPTAMSNAPPTPAIPVNNPGCKSKVIRDYKPRTPGPMYSHPSVIHYVKLYGEDGSKGSLNFREFLAIMSAYKFYRPERIILHSNADFSADRYWQETSEWKNISMEVHPVKVLKEIGGQRVIKLHHVADFLKIQTLIKQGGLASDFDVIILDGTKLREQQRSSECLLSCEMHDLTFEKCIKVNGGFYSCIRNASFMQAWYQNYLTDFRPKDWAYNSGDVPSRILRTKGPQCYNVWTDEEILYPSPGYVNRWMSAGRVQWRSKPAAHYISRFTGLQVEDERILKLNTPLGDMMRHVYNS